ncbi:MAG: flavodoxin family protein [Candidatus Wallbacteria bacterium]
MKKAVIIFGSPRKNGNTMSLVREAQKGLKDNGAESEIFYLNDIKAKGCQACYYCKKNDTDTCCLKDDMAAIHEAMKAADGIIVASPIYFCDMTSQTRMWADRLFPFIDIKLNSKLPKGKKAGFIFTQNQPNADLFVTHMKDFEHAIGLVGYEFKGEVLGVNLATGSKSPANERPELMKQAYELGKNLLK